MKNPFVYGRELGTKDLINRKKEVAEVIRAIKDSGKLFLIGPRRYGKTSILKAAGDRLVHKEKAILLRYNAEAYTDPGQIAGRIIADSAAALGKPLDLVGNAIRKYFQRLQPEISFNATQTFWSAKIGVARQEARDEDRFRLIVDALDGLEKLAHEQPAERPVGLIIDEFQRLISGGQDYEAQIRAAIQQHERVGYVFAGSKTRLLTDMIMDASRPFYRLGSPLFIGEIPRQEFYDFLTSGFAAGGFSIEGRSTKRALTVSQKSPIDMILDYAEEVPYNVQMLAHSCWGDLVNTGVSTLTGEFVARSLETLVRQYDAFYTQIWNQQTVIQQRTLRACLENKGVNLLSIKVTGSTGKGPGTIKRALDAMIARDILREEERTGQIRYRFEDPFFARWISLFTAGL